jgi:hypothetical protein
MAEPSHNYPRVSTVLIPVGVVIAIYACSIAATKADPWGLSFPLYVLGCLLVGIGIAIRLQRFGCLLSWVVGVAIGLSLAALVVFVIGIIKHVR